MSSIAESNKKKEVQAKLDREKALLRIAELALREAKENVSACHNTIARIKRELDNVATGSIIVTDHAILRYMERVEFIPPDTIPAKLLTEELKRMYSILGDGEFPIWDGKHSCVIKNNTIITIK